MNIKEINGNAKGTLSFDDIKFEKIKTLIVKRNNKYGGKINFPGEDIGKTVYVLYAQEKHEKIEGGTGE